jgi:hypothetical protein
MLNFAINLNIISRMKHLLLAGFALLLVLGCKNEPKNVASETVAQQKSTAQLIAEAHGIDQWNKIESISFNFSVAVDSVERPGRTWTWMPKLDSIVLTMADQVTKYQRQQIDSSALGADRAFINDKFWLLIPFQLVWDKGATISDPELKVAPVSDQKMNSISITYPSQGGYTPGDAYDIYYDENYMIREWTYRKGNSPEPSLSTTFEDYKNFNGLMLAMSHRRKDGNWNLMFRDVSLTLD